MNNCSSSQPRSAHRFDGLWRGVHPLAFAVALSVAGCRDSLPGGLRPDEALPSTRIESVSSVVADGEFPALTLGTPPRPLSAPPGGRSAMVATWVLSDFRRWSVSEARADVVDLVMSWNALLQTRRSLDGAATGGKETLWIFHCFDGLDFVLVPGLCATSADGAETRRVRPLLVATTEVTQREWRRVMGTSPSRHVGDDLPVDSVSWVDAAEYCLRTGYSLPDEVEWEHAARAFRTLDYAVGDEPKDLAEYATFSGNSRGAPTRAGSRKSNPTGLFDTLGNVWEWTASRAPKHHQ